MDQIYYCDDFSEYPDNMICSQTPQDIQMENIFQNTTQPDYQSFILYEHNLIDLCTKYDCIVLNNIQKDKYWSYLVSAQQMIENSILHNQLVDNSTKQYYTRPLRINTDILNRSMQSSSINNSNTPGRLYQKIHMIYPINIYNYNQSQNKSMYEINVSTFENGTIVPLPYKEDNVFTWSSYQTQTPNIQIINNQLTNQEVINVVKNILINGHTILTGIYQNKSAQNDFVQMDSLLQNQSYQASLTIIGFGSHDQVECFICLNDKYEKIYIKTSDVRKEGFLNEGFIILNQQYQQNQYLEYECIDRDIDDFIDTDSVCIVYEEETNEEIVEENNEEFNEDIDEEIQEQEESEQEIEENIEEPLEEQEQENENEEELFEEETNETIEEQEDENIEEDQTIPEEEIENINEEESGDHEIEDESEQSEIEENESEEYQENEEVEETEFIEENEQEDEQIEESQIIEDEEQEINESKETNESENIEQEEIIPNEEDESEQQESEDEEEEHQEENQEEYQDEGQEQKQEENEEQQQIEEEFEYEEESIEENIDIEEEINNENQEENIKEDSEEEYKEQQEEGEQEHQEEYQSEEQEEEQQQEQESEEQDKEEEETQQEEQEEESTKPEEEEQQQPIKCPENMIANGTICKCDANNNYLQLSDQLCHKCPRDTVIDQQNVTCHCTQQNYTYNKDINQCQYVQDKKMNKSTIIIISVVSATVFIAIVVIVIIILLHKKQKKNNHQEMREMQSQVHFSTYGQETRSQQFMYNTMFGKI